MDRGTFEDGLDDVLAELRSLMLAKQHDYGHENILAFGERGVLVRANDKVARLKHLLWDRPGEQPANESIRDSWRDLAGYAIIALMLRDGTFALPVADDDAE